MSAFRGIDRRQAVVAGLGGLFMLTADQASAQGQSNLTFWTVRLNTPELAAALKSILADFEAANPGIKIKHEPVSGNLVYPKFLTAIRGQSMPDIAEAYSYHPLQFAAADQMEPMDDIIDLWKKNGLLTDIFSEYAYKKFLWRDHYWGVPYNLDIRPIYYRKDLLEAKGLKPPKTWDEFQAAAIALNDPANGVFGMVFPAGNFHIAQHFYMSFMFQAGGSILDKDGNLVFGTTSKDANVKALTFLTDFATKHKVTPPGIASYNTDEPHTLYVQGRAAFGFGTGGLIGRLLKENPALAEKTGVLEVLEGPAGKAGKLTAAFYNPMFVWKHSPAKEAAKTFVRWFVQPGRLERLYQAVPGQHWPIFKQDINTDRVKSNRLLREALENVVPYSTDFAYPGLGRPEMGVIDGEKMFAAPVNEVVVGAKTPEKAVLDAHEAMKKVFTS
ncbi:sugar ABC transporter substrate-binding protein [Terrarubrum flagellatum]|uniref:ABC transporter substrate-binding protein n=1 Tax=Terrirubrum flagellatum TaxID=2895980 RepID=UPI003145519F